MTMIARMMPADNRPRPTGGPENSAPSSGVLAEHGLQRPLHPGGQDGPEHQQAPHAVDDRRHRGQQLDRGAQRPPQPARRQLGQEQRDAETDRHGDQHRDERTHQRAVDHHQTAVAVLHRVPLRAHQERQPVLLDRPARRRSSTTTMMPASNARVSNAADSAAAANRRSPQGLLAARAGGRGAVRSAPSPPALETGDGQCSGHARCGFRGAADRSARHWLE